jgi:hypothetical protein
LFIFRFVRWHTEIFEHKKYLKYWKACIICVLVIFSTFAIYTVYPSPIIRSYNQQVTYSEVESLGWFLTCRNESLPIDDIKVVPFRFADAILGTNIKKNNIMTAGIWTYPPDHFYYSKDYSNITTGPRSRYLLLTELSSLLYPKVYPEYKTLWRFDESDFHDLESNSKVDKIYTNKNMNIYTVDLSY